MTINGISAGGRDSVWTKAVLRHCRLCTVHCQLPTTEPPSAPAPLQRLAPERWAALRLPATGLLGSTDVHAQLSCLLTVLSSVWGP